MLASRDLFKPVAQTVESKLVTGAPVDFTGAFVGTQNEPMSANKSPLTQIPFKPIMDTIQPVAKPTAAVMGGKADLYGSAGVTPTATMTGAPGSPLVDSLTSAMGGKNPVADLLMGGGMPPIPPLNLNMTTSSEAKTGAQTASGGFVSHGINFGTTGGNNTMLILAAVAVGAFFLFRKK